MKLKIFAGFLTSLLISTSASANLITNGDFSQPFLDYFTSQYDPVPYPGLNVMYPEGTYTVGANPFLVHDLFVKVPGDNPMLLANGATGSDKALLLYTGNVPVAGQYAFSATVMNICCNENFNSPNAPSQVLFQISQNGGAFTTIASHTTSPSPPPPGDSGVPDRKSVV